MEDKNKFMENYWFAYLGDIVVEGVTLMFEDRNTYEIFVKNKDKITVVPQLRNPNPLSQ